MYCLSNFCFLCLNSNTSLVSVTINDGDKKTLYEKLKYCMNDIQYVKPISKTKICKVCADILRVTFEFQRRCREKNKILLDYVEKLSEQSGKYAETFVLLNDDEYHEQCASNDITSIDDEQDCQQNGGPVKLSPENDMFKYLSMYDLVKLFPKRNQKENVEETILPENNYATSSRVVKKRETKKKQLPMKPLKVVIEKLNDKIIGKLQKPDSSSSSEEEDFDEEDDYDEEDDSDEDDDINKNKAKSPPKQNLSLINKIQNLDKLIENAENETEKSQNKILPTLQNVSSGVPPKESTQIHFKQLPTSQNIMSSVPPQRTVKFQFVNSQTLQNITSGLPTKDRVQIPFVLQNISPGVQTKQIAQIPIQNLPIVQNISPGIPTKEPAQIPIQNSLVFQNVLPTLQPKETTQTQVEKLPVLQNMSSGLPTKEKMQIQILNTQILQTSSKETEQNKNNFQTAPFFWTRNFEDVPSSSLGTQIASSNCSTDLDESSSDSSIDDFLPPNEEIDKISKDSSMDINETNIFTEEEKLDYKIIRNALLQKEDPKPINTIGDLLNSLIEEDLKYIDTKKKEKILEKCCKLSKDELFKNKNYIKSLLVNLLRKSIKNSSKKKKTPKVVEPPGPIDFEDLISAVPINKTIQNVDKKPTNVEPTERIVKNKGPKKVWTLKDVSRFIPAKYVVETPVGQTNTIQIRFPQELIQNPVQKEVQTIRKSKAFDKPTNRPSEFAPVTVKRYIFQKHPHLKDIYVNTNLNCPPSNKLYILPPLMPKSNNDATSNDKNTLQEEPTDEKPIADNQFEINIMPDTLPDPNCEIVIKEEEISDVVDEMSVQSPEKKRTTPQMTNKRKITTTDNVTIEVQSFQKLPTVDTVANLRITNVRMLDNAEALKNIDVEQEQLSAVGEVSGTNMCIHRCRVCSKPFLSAANLKLHTRSNHPKIHECSICHGQFKFKYCLKRHLNVHKGENVFLCPFCPLQYGNIYGLKKHCQSVHNYVPLNFESKKFKGTEDDGIEIKVVENSSGT